MWLAESSTRLHYDTLVEFVEIWNRQLKNSLESEVISVIDHSEKNLVPLYDDLRKNFERLGVLLKK